MYKPEVVHVGINVPDGDVAFFAVVTRDVESGDINRVLTSYGWLPMGTSVRETGHVCRFSEEQAQAVIIGYEQARLDATEALGRGMR